MQVGQLLFNALCVEKSFKQFCSKARKGVF